MDLTGGTRNTAAGGATATLGGLAAVVHGIIRNDPAHSVGGGFLALAGLAVLALVAIYRWVTDTRDERRALAATQREAQGRKDTYLAAQAALENEQGRLNRDVAAERAALDARLKMEREAMAAEFEERRAALIAETMEATLLMVQGDKLAPQPSGKVIRFPDQQAERQPERERSRGRGVVGP
ncbi:hypothetical protein AB0M61_01960 [Streptomyces sp. NPDC051642]|uniref:hypothetical protein n=1 Tax=Streptomyces sp. NPDC051642 TaxID=3154646 RepID=UPI003442C46B